MGSDDQKYSATIRAIRAARSRRAYHASVPERIGVLVGRLKAAEREEVRLKAELAALERCMRADRAALAELRAR